VQNQRAYKGKKEDGNRIEKDEQKNIKGWTNKTKKI